MRVLIGVALALGIVSCGGSDASPTTPPATTSKTYDVFTIGDAFSDIGHAIAPNDTVRWNFAGGSDGQGHNVRFSTSGAGTPANISILKTGTATRVFTSKGTFGYVCDVHPGMSGSVLVQ